MIASGIFEKYVVPSVVILVFLFLYLPIIFLIISSFNSGALNYEWGSFTTSWYRELFTSVEVWNAVKNSLIVAITSVFLSVSMGSMLVFFLPRYWLDRFSGLFYANLAVPEVVLSVGLLSFFYFFSVPLGLVTLITGHTLLGLGYVVPVVYNRFVDLDSSIMEASFDLGATPLQTFWKVVLPLMMPALIVSGLLVFTISFDDFIFAFFCSGSSSQTLPIYIYSMIRSGATPEITALSALLLGMSSLLVLAFLSLQIRKMGGVR